MKTLFYSIITLCSLTTFGQVKTTQFKEEITYKSLEDDTSKQLVLKSYISKDKNDDLMFIDSSFGGLFNFTTVVSNGSFFDVKHSFIDNSYTITNYPFLSFLGVSSENIIEEMLKKSKSLVKTTRSNKILNQNCDYYTTNENDLSFCINTNSDTDNVSTLLPNANVKGLILEVTDSHQEESFLRIVEQKTVNLPFKFDLKDAIAKKEEFVKELEELNSWNYPEDSVDTAYAAEAAYSPDNRYEDPIINYYNYQTSDNDNVNNLFSTIASLNYNLVYTDNDYDGNPDIERSTALTTAQGSTNQLVKQFKKNKLANKSEIKELNNLFKTYFDDARKFKLTEISSDYDNVTEVSADPPVEEAWAYAELAETYTSNYKNMSLEEMNFAFTGYADQEELINTLPKYCTKSNVPDFKNVEFKNNVENYIGQLCDLYISKFVYNVGITETTDALRYSFLKINELKSKLSKEEQIKFDQFINNLD